MSKHGIATLALASLLWLSGCGSSAPMSDAGEVLPSSTPPEVVPTKPAAPTPEPQSSPTAEDSARGLIDVDPEDVAVAQSAMDFLAAQSGMALSEMQVIRVDEVEWPNSALGCPQPGQMYMEMITPGFRIVVEVGGERFDVHTNSDGSSAVLCEGEVEGLLDEEETAAAGEEVSPTAAPALPTATAAPTQQGSGSGSVGGALVAPVVPLPTATGVLGSGPVNLGMGMMAAAQATKLVAERSGLSAESLTIVERTSTTWPDSGLGCGQPGMMYLTVLTPGYKFVVEAGGQRYFVHTNSDGRNAVLCERDVLPPPSSDQ